MRAGVDLSPPSTRRARGGQGGTSPKRATPRRGGRSSRAPGAMRAARRGPSRSLTNGTRPLSCARAAMPAQHGSSAAVSGSRAQETASLSAVACARELACWAWEMGCGVEGAYHRQPPLHPMGISARRGLRPSTHCREPLATPFLDSCEAASAARATLARGPQAKSRAAASRPLPIAGPYDRAGTRAQAREH